MTITANLADGRQLQFPDGTDPSVIAKVAKQYTMQERAPRQSKQLSGRGSASPAAQPAFKPGLTWRGEVIRPSNYQAGEMAGIQKGVTEDFDTVKEAAARGVGDVSHWAGLTGWTPGKTVKASDDKQLAKMDQQSSSLPGYQGGTEAGQIIGTLPLAEVGGEMLGAIPQIARAGESINSLLDSNSFTRAASMIPKAAAKGVVPGAIAGATTDRNNPGQGAFEGGAAGAAGGAAFGAAALTGQFGRWVLAAPVKAVIEAVKPAERKAAATVLRALYDQGMTPQTAAAELKSRGPNAMLADLPQMRGAGKGVINNVGPGPNAARDALEQRASGAEERVAASIKTATGGAGDIHGTTEDLIKARSKSAAPLFKKLDGIKPTAEQIGRVQGFIDSPEGQKALASGLTTMRRQMLGAGRKFDPSQFGLIKAEDGRLSIAQGKPSMPLLQAIKEGFDDLVEGERNAVGQLPKTKEVGSLDDLRNSYRNTLTEMFPDYKAALDAWSGPSKSLGAQAMGRKVLSNDPEVTTKIIGAMSDNDKAFFLNGLSRTLIDKIQNNAESTPDARTIFGNTAIRGKIQAALGKGETFDHFAHEMQQEINIAQANRTYLGGSPTSENESAKGAFGRAGSAVRGLAHAFSGNPFRAAGHFADAAKGLPPDQAFLSEMSKLLFSPDQTNMLAALMRNSPTMKMVTGALGRQSNHLVRMMAAGAGAAPNIGNGG